jgi:hypothetical protein
VERRNARKDCPYQMRHAARMPRRNRAVRDRGKKRVRITTVPAPLTASQSTIKKSDSNALTYAPPTRAPVPPEEHEAKRQQSKRHGPGGPLSAMHQRTTVSTPIGASSREQEEGCALVSSEQSVGFCGSVCETFSVPPQPATAVRAGRKPCSRQRERNKGRTINDQVNIRRGDGSVLVWGGAVPVRRRTNHRWDLPV